MNKKMILKISRTGKEKMAPTFGGKAESGKAETERLGRELRGSSEQVSRRNHEIPSPSHTIRRELRLDCAPIGYKFR